MTPKIEKLRAQIAELKQAIQRVEDGQVRLPKAQAIEALDQFLSAQATEGARRLTGWCAHFAQPAPRPGDLLYANPSDPFGLSCFVAALAPEHLRARLVGLLEADYSDQPETLPLEARPAWLASKRAELLQLEGEDFSESRSAKILQRPDMDPRVLLGIH